MRNKDFSLRSKLVCRYCSRPQQTLEMHRSLQISARKRKNFATMTDSVCQAHHLHRDFYCFSRNIKKKRGKHCLKTRNDFRYSNASFFTNIIQSSKKWCVKRIVTLSETNFHRNLNLSCMKLYLKIKWCFYIVLFCKMNILY